MGAIKMQNILQINDESPDKKYLSAKNVANRYDVSQDCIYRWARVSDFPKPRKINGSTRWKVSELDEWDSKFDSAQKQA